MGDKSEISSSCDQLLEEPAMVLDNLTDSAEFSFSSSIGSDELADIALAFDQPSLNFDKSESEDLDSIALSKPPNKWKEEYEERKQRQLLLEAMWKSKKVANGIVELLIEEAVITSNQRDQVREFGCPSMQLSHQIKGRNGTTSIEKKPKTETGIKDITGEHDRAINEEVFLLEDDIWMEKLNPSMENMVHGSEFENINEDITEKSLLDGQEDEFMVGGAGGGGDASISGRWLKTITDNKRADESDEDNVIRI